jgi:ABC-type phosphonate transport system ATPase subunit
MPGDIEERLSRSVEARRDELVELTRELIRYPTVNPPGEAYLPCAELRSIADRVYVMQQGRIVEHGATQAVFASPRHPYTRQLIAATPQIEAALAARELGASGRASAASGRIR